MKCRHCGSPLSLPFIDLGSAPPSNAYLTDAQLHAPEKWFPLRVLVCEQCWLVQTEDYAGAEELFNDEYAYFSSMSSTWLEHARTYVGSMVDRFRLDSGSVVAEIAANDGYLLQYVKGFGIACCYGIEPTRSTAQAARDKGIEIVEEFFGLKLAAQLAAGGRSADLVVCNNVLAHVPDINDFVMGITALLKEQGCATFEFPYLPNLVRDNQFDTIYHEHYSYLSLTAVDRIFEVCGLRVVDVERLETHGGSIRVFAQRSDFEPSVYPAVAAMLAEEQRLGISNPAFYAGLQQRAENVKHGLLTFLIEQKKAGRKVAAYGAAAKGNTLLNFAGIREDLLTYVVDRSPGKQGKFLPGSRIPIVDEARMMADRPDWVLVLPWNLQVEIERQLAGIRVWGGCFVRAVPSIQIS